MQYVEDFNKTMNCPNEYGSFNVVQLFVDGQPYLRFFSNIGVSYHSAILKNFLKWHKIEFATIIGIESKDQIPALKGDKYLVCGMGKAEVDPNDKTITCYDKSGDYGIGIDAEHLDLIRELEPEWTIYFLNNM